MCCHCDSTSIDFSPNIITSLSLVDRDGGVRGHLTVDRWSCTRQDVSSGVGGWEGGG